MSIDNFTEKIKTIKDSHREILINILIIVIIVLVASGSFGLGRLSKIKENNEDIGISNVENSNLEDNNQTANVVSANILNSESNTEEKVTTQNQAVVKNSVGGKQFVASKNGTKYYFVWCGGAGRIKEENKVYFSTKEEAEKAGFTKASTCKGL